MSERKQNWYTRFVKWFGPSLFLETGNPRMDAGGGSAFTLFGSTKRGRKFSMGMKESGIVQLNADATLEIIAGEENDDGGEDILINSRNGAIDIKVTKNGDVRISGSNVSIKADAAIDIHGRVVRIKGDDEILAIYNFKKTKEGISITNKQSLMLEKTMLMVSEDAAKLSENIGIAFQENPELIQSLIK